MKRFRLYEMITGLAVFVVAAVTYLLTVEPSVPFWDCGEFIASADKLEVGHPPGAPFFMLVGRVLAAFTSDPTHVAKVINSFSALCSAATILFLFWTITHLARKIVVKDENDFSLLNMGAILGAGVVGALAYTFSDTFWFSAVEGNSILVYSSLGRHRRPRQRHTLDSIHSLSDGAVGRSTPAQSVGNTCNSVGLLLQENEESRLERRTQSSRSFVCNTALRTLRTDTGFYQGSRRIRAVFCQ